MNIFKEFKHMLSSDGSDKFSSKRVITFLAFILVSTAFMANLIGDITIDKNMFDGMIQIVWAGLGVVVGEHLLKKKNEEVEKVVLSTPEVLDEFEPTALTDKFGNVITPKEPNTDEELGDN